jgi:uncharacterized protein YidB (DUF937 family)
MEINELCSQLLSQKMGIQVDSEVIGSALGSLLGDGQGNLDLAGLAGKMASSGELGNIVSSWLGDGANASISPDSIMAMLGEDKVASFASQLGTDSGQAATGLADILPQIMDQSSSGGSLLDSAGGLGGLMGAAKSLLG